jgi:hypothetical protein
MNGWFNAMFRESETAIAVAQSRSVKLQVSAARGKFVIVMLGVFGLALVAVGTPRTVAAWYNTEADAALQKLQEQGTLSIRELATGIAALQQSLFWSRSARRLSDLSVLELVQARALPLTDPQRNSVLTHSERHLSESLIANPVDGFGWLRLAVLREFLGVPRRDIAAALIKSLDMAPNARALWIPRATMLFAYWLDLTSDELLAVKSHLQIVWSSDEAIRLPLLQGADRIGNRAFIAWALIGNAQAMKEFDSLASKLPSD